VDAGLQVDVSGVLRLVAAANSLRLVVATSAEAGAVSATGAASDDADINAAARMLGAPAARLVT